MTKTPPASLVGRPLSSRETEVLSLLEKRLRDKEIAAALQISTRTVKYYEANARAKSGTRDRVELLLWFVQRGVAAPSIEGNGRSVPASAVRVVLTRVEKDLAIISSAVRDRASQIQRALEAAASARDSLAQFEEAFEALKTSIAGGGDA